MLKILLFIFLYILYGIFLAVFMIKFKIFEFHKNIEKELNSILFISILTSPIMTVIILFYVAPIRLFKYLIGLPVMPKDDNDKICPTYTPNEMESTSL